MPYELHRLRGLNAGERCENLETEPLRSPRSDRERRQIRPRLYYVLFFISGIPALLVADGLATHAGHYLRGQHWVGCRHRNRIDARARAKQPRRREALNALRSTSPPQMRPLKPRE